MIPKYRAWDKKGEALNEVTAIEWSLEYVEFMNGAVERSFDDVVIMQSTEFKDNNDTEIFEGDVVNIHWFYADFDPVELGAFENEEYAERVTVKKEFGNFGFWWEEADSWVDLATLAMSSRLDEESFEILGNIYENPELLSNP